MAPHRTGSTMLNNLIAKALGGVNLYLIIASAAFAAGWLVHGWKEDSANLAVERAAQAITEKAMARESDIAGKVEQTLAGLSANQTVIDRGIIREIEKPIYMRVCLEPGAISLLNAAARGEAPAAAAEPGAKVP